MPSLVSHRLSAISLKPSDVKRSKRTKASFDEIIKSISLVEDLRSKRVNAVPPIVIIVTGLSKKESSFWMNAIKSPFVVSLIFFMYLKKQHYYLYFSNISSLL